MQDLMEKLQNILSTKEGQEQLNNITKMLNINKDQPNNHTNQPNNFNQQDFNQQDSNVNQQGNQDSQNGNGFDISSLAGLFSNQQNSQPNNNSNNNNSNNNNFDFSSLANMFSNMSSNSNNENNNNLNNEQNPMPNIDINMIMKMQQIFSKMNVSDKNSQLLLSLKPHFGESRRKKVDQAISMMRLMSILPALKDSGIFEIF